MSRETGEDVIYMRNSNFHEMNMSEDTAPRMSSIDYHENITMDDAASEIDNTRIRELKDIVYQVVKQYSVNGGVIVSLCHSVFWAVELGV